MSYILRFMYVRERAFMLSIVNVALPFNNNTDTKVYCYFTSIKLSRWLKARDYIHTMPIKGTYRTVDFVFRRRNLYITVDNVLCNEKLRPK